MFKNLIFISLILTVNNNKLFNSTEIDKNGQYIEAEELKYSTNQIEIIIEFDYDAPKNKLDFEFNDNLEVNQSILTNIRKNNEYYYSYNNKNLLKINKFDTYRFLFYTSI